MENELISQYPKAIIFYKKYGDGLKPITMGFNEHRRRGLIYIILVDSTTNIYDMHDLAEEIENDLVDEYGLFDRHEDFELYREEVGFADFEDWFDEKFPIVDIQGGSSNWNEIKLNKNNP